MRPVTTSLLFPYFLPLMTISAIAFAWMLVTPNDPGVTGPTGGDILGVFWMMACAMNGVVAQAVVGVPFCRLLEKTVSPLKRFLLAIAALAVALVPFGILLAASPPTISELVATLVVVVGCFAVGVWIPVRNLHPRDYTVARSAGEGKRARASIS